MKVLVATTVGQERVPGDYCWTVEGELVYLALVDCRNPKCGCERGFAGLSSARATTTAMVIERSDLAVRDVEDALIAGLERQGWLGQDWSDEDRAEIFAEYWRPLAMVADGFDDGDVLERNGEFVRRRGTIAELGGSVGRA